MQLVKSLLGFPPCPLGGETRVSQFLVPYGYYQEVALCCHLKLALSVIPFCILTGKAEVLAVLFSSITLDCGVFLCYFPARVPAGSLVLSDSVGKSGGPRVLRAQACV